MNIVQSKPFIDNKEYEAIEECFSSTWLTEGPKSQLFVEKLVKILDIRYGVLANNGTLALFLALKALGITDGDEVLVTNHTFIASANSIVMAGATPVFVDCGKDLQIDIKQCSKSGVLSEKTKAIMPVHLYGSAVNMDDIMEFAEKHNLLVIEDSCQAFGVKYSYKSCGTFGNIGCFSFFADKPITTGEGGFVATNNENYYDNLRYLRNQGRLNRSTFIHPNIGFNFRLTDIHSVIGLEQLKKSSYIFSKRRDNYDIYTKLLNGIKEVDILRPSKNTTSFIPFRVVLLVKGPQQDLSDFLKDRGIEARTLFYPLHKQPCFEFLKNRFGYKDEDFVNSVSAYEHGLCLPVYPNLTEEEIKYICDTIKEYYS